MKNHLHPKLYISDASFKLLQRLEITLDENDKKAAKRGIKEVIELFKVLEEPPQIKIILFSLPSIDI